VARRIDIDEVFRKLRPALGLNGAVDEMNKAMLRDDKRARLFCDGHEVNPNFIRDHLIMKGPGSRRANGRRRRRAEIVATQALDKPVEAYTWKMDGDEIEALLPQAAEASATVQRQGSRTQEAIRKFAAKKWPDGFKHVEARDLIKAVGDALGLPISKRDTILRALGRRR
jgi:hypothetical protein